MKLTLNTVAVVAAVVAWLGAIFALAGIWSTRPLGLAVAVCMAALIAKWAMSAPDTDGEPWQETYSGNGGGTMDVAGEQAVWRDDDELRATWDATVFGSPE